MVENKDLQRLESYLNKKGSLAIAKDKIRPLASILLSLVRRAGKDKIYIIPDYARGGNYLYVWAQAAIDRLYGQPSYVKYIPAMDSWIDEFPKLKEITYMSPKIKFTDSRSIGFHQEINKHQLSELKFFIDEYLLTSKKFISKLDSHKEFISDTTVVVNVRRGDYYSIENIRKEFGIDTISYIKSAVENLRTTLDISNFYLVSDDIEWCKENLKFLEDIAPIIPKTLESTPFEDFAAVCSSKNLILTNTTFGYWGGYVASTLRQANVLVPRFHELSVYRESENYKPMQHLNSWIQVDLPQGEWIQNEK